MREGRHLPQPLVAPKVAGLAIFERHQALAAEDLEQHRPEAALPPRIQAVSLSGNGIGELAISASASASGNGPSVAV